VRLRRIEYQVKNGRGCDRPNLKRKMRLTGIAQQIEAQSRARARRYETEYLANIFGLDWERSSLTLCSEQGARCFQSKESEAPSPSPLPSQGEELRRGSEGARQGARVRLRRIEYQVKNGCGFNRPNIKREMPLFEDIVSAVAEATHIAPAEIHGRSRRQRIAYARQLAMYLMRQITRASYPLIGDFFGRNHSTVIYACDSIRARLPFDAEGRRALDKIATIFSDRRPELQQDMGKE
jgi:hypothetical protein